VRQAPIARGHSHVPVDIGARPRAAGPCHLCIQLGGGRLLTTARQHP
jgi:hypothetical protein